ncbi:MAG: RNA polymerase sigma factor [Oscillospiraceae bacterium]|nr:RNA polymerase sigma factor [Oscillospiraceae bacterium]
MLGNAEDTEEVINDTYHRIWNAIPPERPNSLRAFVGRITRNLSFDRLDKAKAEKRGSGQLDALLSELEECIADSRNSFDELIETEAITVALNAFLSEQSADNRRIFVRRYWRAASIDEIAADFDMSVGKVKTTLFRTRKKLRKHLESEGIYL